MSGFLTEVATDAGMRQPEPVTVVHKGREVPLGSQRQAIAAASEAALGAIDAPGGFLSSVEMTPLSLSPGPVTITDGNEAPVTIFAGGGGSVQTLSRFTAPLEIRSRSGRWKITTGPDISAQAIGVFP